MDYRTFVSGIGFTMLQPDTFPSPEELARLNAIATERKIPFDVLNTSLPTDQDRARHTLEAACRVPRMSTFAIAAMINRAVAEMPAHHAFVNIGVWNGFSLLAGMAGNADRICIGVDNFSDFGGPREDFGRRFRQHASASHAFHDMDYRAYFEREHHAPIGVYFYDGDHSYEHQRLGLEIAAPYLADDCIIFVDDTNTHPARAATYAFLTTHPGYHVLLDARTCANGHPTWWNGIVVIQRGGRAGGSSATGF